MAKLEKMKKTFVFIALGVVACNEPATAPGKVETARADSTQQATAEATRGVAPSTPESATAADAGTPDGAADEPTTPKSMKDARVVPAIEDGAVIGLRFDDVKAGSATASAGIQSGDIVKMMDRTPMTGAMQSLIFFQRLDAKTPMSVDLVRNGKPVHLEVNR
jgi:type II secretory pathway component PulC